MSHDVPIMPHDFAMEIPPSFHNKHSSFSIKNGYFPTPLQPSQHIHIAPRSEAPVIRLRRAFHVGATRQQLPHQVGHLRDRTGEDAMRVSRCIRYPPVSSNMTGNGTWTIEIGAFPSSIKFGDFCHVRLPRRNHG